MTYADTVPGPDGRPLDQIRLTGVRATGHHGVLPHERAEGQTFSADVVLHLDTRSAAASDDLAATVSYAEVATDVHAVLAGDPVDLVETLAERVAAVVLAHSAVQAVDVRVHKPQAPIDVPFDDVEIVVRRDRSDLPEEAALAQAAPEEAEPVAAAVPVPAPVPVPVSHEDTPESFPVPAAPSEAVREPVKASTHDVVEASALVDPLDAAPPAPVGAVLALGSNVGDPQGTLRAAVTDIDRIPGVQVMEVSPLARTVAVGPEQPDFLNAVLLVRTTLPPRDLLGACQEIELLHGRERNERWGPRTLDIDIVVYGDLTSNAEDLELPHPRAHERAFVLVPWAELDPEAVLGGLGGGPVAQLATTAPDRSGIRWLALDWLTEPASTGAVQAQPVAAEPVPSEPVPSQPEPAREEYRSEPAREEYRSEPAPPAPEPPSSPEEPPAPRAEYRPAAEPDRYAEPEVYVPQVPPAPAVAPEPSAPPAWAPERFEPPAPDDAPPTPSAGTPRQAPQDLVTAVPGLPSAPVEIPPSAPESAEPAMPQPVDPQQWTVPGPQWTAPAQPEFYEPESRAFGPAPQVYPQHDQGAYLPEREGPPAYVPPPVSGPQQVAPASSSDATPFALPPAPGTDPGYPPYAGEHRPPGHG